MCLAPQLPTTITPPPLLVLLTSIGKKLLNNSVLQLMLRGSHVVKRIRKLCWTFMVSCAGTWKISWHLERFWWFWKKKNYAVKKGTQCKWAWSGKTRKQKKKWAGETDLREVCFNQDCIETQRHVFCTNEGFCVFWYKGVPATFSWRCWYEGWL